MKRESTYGCIYVLTCLANMKEYVGQAKCWNSRWRNHLFSAQNGSSQAIHQAIRRHGAENFAVTIIRKCSLFELNYWEEYYIEKFDTILPSGYNMTDGGESLSGFKHSSATRAKIAATAKTNWQDAEHRKRHAEQRILSNRNARQAATLKRHYDTHPELRALRSQLSKAYWVRWRKNHKRLSCPR